MIEVLEKADTSERKMTMEEAMNLVELAMRVNGLERRNSNVGELNYERKYPAVFTRFYGHTASLEISVHMDGWIFDSSPDNTFCFYLDRTIDKYEYDRCTGCLQELIEWMEKDSEQKNAPTADQSNVGA